MEAIVPKIQEKLKVIVDLKYIDENTGQIDSYSPNFPVQWPCALIDITDANFSNLGINPNKKPKNRQLAEMLVEITVANIKLTNTSGLAPINQQNEAWSIFTLLNKIHAELQGFCPTDTSSKLIRVNQHRNRRDDGVQEYKMIYSLSINEV